MKIEMTSIATLIASLLIVSSALTESIGVDVPDFIRSYEKINYEAVWTKLKVSVNQYTAPVKIRFDALNRTFDLVLWPIDKHSTVFDQESTIDLNGFDSQLSLSGFLYHGKDKNDEFSVVHGSLIDGLFSGHINYGNGDSFTVENAKRYLNASSILSHSIIYSDSDINYPVKHRHKRSSSGDWSTCGLTGQIEERMSNRQKRYADIDTEIKGEWEPETNERRNRRTPQDNININGTTIFNARVCHLWVRTDQVLFKYVHDTVGENENPRTMREITAIVWEHVQAVNEIYGAYSFYGITGIKFAIKRLTVFSPDSCLSAWNGTKNPFCNENAGVEMFLRLNTQDDHFEYCLVYTLTYRDFAEGVVGLAYTTEEGNAGGVCDIPRKKGSFNAGIITLKNFGRAVPPRTSHITMAHEIAHNFGAKHDETPECKPGMPDGDYIMSPLTALTPTKNSNKFSECSIKAMARVMFKLMRSNPRKRTRKRRTNCFQYEKAFCGNGVKEGNEQCDCGSTLEECLSADDHCCTPGQCVPLGGATCSPADGPCCDPRTCNPYKPTANKRCRQRGECMKEQFCNGKDAQCPPSDPNDAQYCGDMTMLCDNGICNRSICEKLDMRECTITSQDRDEMCHVACLTGNGSCISTFNLPQFEKTFGSVISNGDKGVLRRPGSLCNDRKGNCDIFRKCRDVDTNGPLRRAAEVLKTVPIDEARNWIADNWWIVALVSCGSILVLGLFVRVCVVHTPSTNPHKPIPPTFSEIAKSPQRYYSGFTTKPSNNERKASKRRRLKSVQKPLEDRNGVVGSAGTGPITARDGGDSKDAQIKSDLPGSELGREGEEKNVGL